MQHHDISNTGKKEYLKEIFKKHNIHALDAIELSEEINKMSKNGIPPSQSEIEEIVAKKSKQRQEEMGVNEYNQKGNTTPAQERKNKEMLASIMPGEAQNISGKKQQQILEKINAMASTKGKKNKKQIKQPSKQEIRDYLEKNTNLDQEHTAQQNQLRKKRNQSTKNKKRSKVMGKALAWGVGGTSLFGILS